MPKKVQTSSGPQGISRSGADVPPQRDDERQVIALLRGLGAPEELIPSLSDAIRFLGETKSADVVASTRREALEAQKEAMRQGLEGQKEAMRQGIASQNRISALTDRLDQVRISHQSTTQDLGEAKLRIQSLEVENKKRYLDYLLLRDGVSLREELNIIEDKYAEKKRQEDGAKKRAGRWAVWAYFFQQADRKVQREFEEKTREKELAECYKMTSRSCDSAQSAASAMEKILRVLNSRFHRKHFTFSQEEIQQTEAIPLQVSPSLPLSDCELLFCVFQYETKPAKIYRDSETPWPVTLEKQQSSEERTTQEDQSEAE